MKKLIISFFTNHVGDISSKIVIGALGFLVLLITTVIIMFLNPEFPGLEDIVTILIITSASLLGLTTFENISQTKSSKKKKFFQEGDCEEDEVL